MRMSLSKPEYAALLSRQLENMAPDGRPLGDVTRVVDSALQRLEFSFKHIAIWGFRDKGAYFNHLHADQYASYLYFASSTAWKELENVELAGKLFQLNKAMNGLVCMYDTILPDVFLLNHTVGTVLGKAAYGDFFVTYQNTNVGTDNKHQPALGKGTILYPGASIVGGSSLGDEVTVAARSFIRSETVPTGSVVAGASPNLIVRPAKERYLDRYFLNAPSV